jgi:hypothetical protein
VTSDDDDDDDDDDNKWRFGRMRIEVVDAVAVSLDTAIIYPEKQENDMKCSVTGSLALVSDSAPSI